MSLLANSDTPELIAYSCREYEDLAGAQLDLSDAVWFIITSFC